MGDTGKSINKVQKQHGLASPLTEISLVVFCVLLAEWAVLPLFGKGSLVGLVPVCAALVIMVLSHRARRESLRELGWRIDNFWYALKLLIPPMALATLFLVVLGWLCGSLRIVSVRPGWQLLFIFLELFLWGLLQQYALQSFVNRRAQLIWGSGAISTLFAATLFSVLHLPNLWLMAATFFGGLLWAWTYQRAPNLISLALSHAIMTVVLVLTVPYTSLHGMRVGYGYFQ